jgi:hypothetical protein
LIKTDNWGLLSWSKTYGDTNYEYCYSLQQTTDNGYIIAGSIWKPGIDSSDIILIKINLLGDTVWTKILGGFGFDWARCVRQTSDSGYIITGGTSSSGAGNEDLYLVKLNSFGDTVWSKTYGWENNDHGYAVKQTLDGGYIITGWTNVHDTVNYNLWILKTDAIGDTSWSFLYDASYSKGTSVLQLTNGDIMVAGWAFSYSTNTIDFILLRINPNGNPLWIKTYGEYSQDYCYSLNQTADSGYILTGTTISFYPSVDDILLIKVDDNGDSLWANTFGGNELERGWVGQQTNDGGYVVAGYTESFGAGGKDYYLIKTKNEISIEDKQISSTIRKMVKIYPNPFHERINITYQLLDKNNISIKIYNVLGQEIKTLLSKEQTDGIYTITWDGIDKYGSASFNIIYFINFSINKMNSYTIKLVRLK